MPAPGTFGALLAQADAAFSSNGGYKASAFCEERRVDLIHQDPNGNETVLSSAPMPEGIAPEDIANGLLVAEIGEVAAKDLYFVITIC